MAARQSFSRSTRRLGAALLLTMLLLLLLIAGVAELATSTAVERVAQARRQRGLAHDLVVDSALLVVGDRLSDRGDLNSPLVEDLDRQGWAVTVLEMGDVQVTCTLRDDGAKFNPNLLPAEHQQAALERALGGLAARRALPRAILHLQPLRSTATSGTPTPYRWFDQVLSGVEPGLTLRLGDMEDTQPVWSDVMSLWGDGRVDLRRAPPEVLDAALGDIRPALGRKLLAVRPADRSIDFTRTALIAVDAAVRGRVAQRLTFDARRYALEIETTIGADHRRWYVVAHIHGGRVEVLHRSRVTW